MDALGAATKSDHLSNSQEGRELSLDSSGEDRSPYTLQRQHISKSAYLDVFGGSEFGQQQLNLKLKPPGGYDLLCLPLLPLAWF